MNPRVTTLMVKPLSRRCQLLSPSILTWVMFLGLLHQVSGLGIKKGTFWDIFRLWQPCLRMPVEWLLVSEGSSLHDLLPEGPGQNQTGQWEWWQRGNSWGLETGPLQCSDVWSSPLSHLNSLFRQSCQDPLDNLSQDGQNYHIQNNFGFSSDTAQLHWQNEWYTWLTGLLLQLHLRFLGPLHLWTWPLLPWYLSLLQFHYFPP